MSYKWEDEAHNAWVMQLAADLRSRGIDALLDIWEVGYGESFTDYMTTAINSSHVVLFVMTPKAVEAVESPHGKGALKFEIQLSTAKRIAGDNFRLIGLLRKGEKIAAHVRDFRFVDFRDDNKYYESLISLVNDLLGLPGKPDLGSQRPPQVDSSETKQSSNDSENARRTQLESRSTLQPAKKEHVGGYIYVGCLYALPALLALFSGYELQAITVSAQELIGLLVPVSFSVFFYLCYAYRSILPWEWEVEDLGSSLIEREALYIYPVAALFVSLSIYFAVGRSLPSRSLLYSFLLYAGLFFTYGLYLLTRPVGGILPVRHQLIWPAILSFAVTLYYGLSFSLLRESAAALTPVILIVIVFIVSESLSGSRSVVTFFVLVCVGLGALFMVRSIRATLIHSIASMLFCMCVAGYLAVFDAWKFTSNIARASELTLVDRPLAIELRSHLTKLAKISTATSIALTLTACLLPFLFIFSEYGTVFLLVFLLHATAAIVFWFRYGNDVTALRKFSWSPIKSIASILFLFGLVIASTFRGQPSRAFLPWLVTPEGAGIVLPAASLSTLRLLTSIRRIYRASGTNRTITLIKVFLERINLVRLLSTVSWILFLIIVALTHSAGFDNKLTLAGHVYVSFVFVGVLIEWLHFVNIRPHYRSIAN